MSQSQARSEFLRGKLRHLATYFGAQGITIAGNLVYGLLCVRLLPISDYARFAVLFGYLGSLTVLLDIGTSNSLAPLIAERIDDLQLIADYVASLRQLAYWLYAIMAPVTMVVLPLLVARQHWPLPVVAAMVAIVLFAAWFARISSAYGAVLILRRDRKPWYRAQMISSLGTLALLLVLWPLHWINAWSAILLNVAGIVFTSQVYYWRARRLLATPGQPSQQKRQAILRLILPNTPNVIFYALQGQISLLLITYFGRTSGIASIGALSRLGQLFIIFSQMNPILIEPYFAKLPTSSLKRNYLAALSGLLLLCLGVCALAWITPELFLWVLGPKYASLRFELLLFLAASSLRYFSGTLWVIHSSRRFVYWWNNIATICSITIVQILFLAYSDLSIIRNVLLSNLISASADFCVALLCGFWGFTRGPRKIEST